MSGIGAPSTSRQLPGLFTYRELPAGQSKTVQVALSRKRSTRSSYGKANRRQGCTPLDVSAGGVMQIKRRVLFLGL